MGFICLLLDLYLIILLVRIILSWIPISYGSPLEGFASLMYALTEPLLGPLRRTIPPLRFGHMALDLSPLTVIIGLRVLSGFIC